MQKFEMNLLEYERILRKQYKVILFCIIMVMVSSLFFMRSKTRLYKAQSSIKIDKTSEQSGIIPDNYWDNMETQVMVVTSSPVMELAAKEMGIIDSAMPSEEIKRNEKMIRILQDLASKVSAKNRGQSTIIDITVVTRSGAETRNLANAVANSYKVFSRREKSRTVRETRLFIEKQLDKCKLDLSANEAALKTLMEMSPHPTIDDKLRRTLERQTGLVKANKELGSTIEDIITQMGEIEKRKAWSDFNLKDKVVSEQERPYIDWISSVGAPDPGLDKLNEKLLDLELKKSELLNFYKTTHPKIRDLETEIVNILVQISREYSSRLNLYRKQFDSNAGELEECRIILQGIPEEQQAFSQIQRSMATNTELFNMLSSKYQLAMISEAGSTDEVTVLSYAVTPGDPFNVNTTKVVIISLIIGLMLGVMIALLIETIDTSIGTIEDMEEYLKIPVIGVLAHTRREDTLEIVQTRMNNPDIGLDLPCLSLITLFDPKSPDAEAFRSLRTNIQFIDIHKNIKVISFTSTVMQEGKSTTLGNLALTMAMAGNRTLLIGCNLRRPSLHRVFGIPKGPGVIDILIEKDKWQNCIHTLQDSEFEQLKNPDLFGVAGFENLHIITSGGIPPNPSELLQSKNMDIFLKSVRDHYDIVLVDSPPILPVTDAAVLGTKVDGTVIIYQTGRVPRNALRRAKIKLENVNTNVLGLVLNDTKSEVSGYFTGYYRYYMDDKGMTKKKKRRPRSSNFSFRTFAMGLLQSSALPIVANLVRKSLLVQIIAVGAVTFTTFKALSARFMPESGDALPAISEQAPASIDHALDSAVRGLTPTAHKGTPAKQAARPSEAAIPAPRAAKSAPLSVVLPPAAPYPVKVVTPGAEAAGVYFIQISSWRSLEQARNACAELLREGIEAYIRSYPGKNGTAYRVCHGEFTNRDEAFAAMAGLPRHEALAGMFPNRADAGEKIDPLL